MIQPTGSPANDASYLLRERPPFQQDASVSPRWAELLGRRPIEEHQLTRTGTNPADCSNEEPRPTVEGLDQVELTVERVLARPGRGDSDGDHGKDKVVLVAALHDEEPVLEMDRVSRDRHQRDKRQRRKRRQ